MNDHDFTWAPPPFRPLIRAVIATAAATPGVIGLTVGGSAASGTMDRYSDLDFVIVCADAKQPSLLQHAPDFAGRVGPLLTAFTGEHVGERRLLICLYGPPLRHVDYLFIAERDLATRHEDGRILWERDEAVTRAYASHPASRHPLLVQWIEDRFWTWVHYGATKIGRGELFECLDHLTYLRGAVLGPMIAAQRGSRPNRVRRLEQIAPELTDVLAATIGDHTAQGCLAALRTTVDLYRQLREAYPELRCHVVAEEAAVAYLDEIEAGVMG